MPQLTGGGASNITGANITDGSIADADISNTAAINPTKILGLIGAPGAVISIETTSAATHALTTVAGQRVIVIAKGEDSKVSNNGAVDVNLKYNGVIKDKVTIGVNAGSGNTSGVGFCLAYSEIPGAATQNITVDGGAGLGNVKIFVIKVQTT